MMFQAPISKIYCTLSANQKRDSELNVYCWMASDRTIGEASKVVGEKSLSLQIKPLSDLLS